MKTLIVLATSRVRLSGGCVSFPTIAVVGGDHCALLLYFSLYGESPASQRKRGSKRLSETRFSSVPKKKQHHCHQKQRPQ
ncbi:MAG: hypothetical protein P8J33_16980, partial [Pirellulaceae bacterium]|nr:hypothetical protein [Pirellulaceae bacterium]